MKIVFLITAGLFIILSTLVYGTIIHIQNIAFNNHLIVTCKQFLEKIMHLFKGEKLSFISGIIGGMAGVVLTLGSPYMLWGYIGGMLSVMGVIFAINITYRIHLQNLKRKECYILFSAIDRYLDVGLSLRKALLDSSQAIKYLKPAIKRCDNYWSKDPSEALKRLEKDINLPEGSVLVAKLLQLEQQGKQQGSITREVKRMERLRVKKEKGLLPYKSLYLSLYRFLPIMAIFGLIAGTALTYSVNVLQGVGIDIF